MAKEIANLQTIETVTIKNAHAKNIRVSLTGTANPEHYQRPFLDMFMELVYTDRGESGVIRVTDNCFNGHSLDRVWDEAIENTFRNSHIQSLASKMADMGMKILDESDTVAPYFMSASTNNALGSGAMMCKELLTEFCQKHNCGMVYIMPSSIHEVLLFLPNPGVNKLRLDSMVREINEAEVIPEERLSNHAYVFSVAANGFAG